MEEKYTSQILAYLNQQLGEDDKAAFEQAMARDKALAEEVQLYEDLYDVHEVIEEEALVATIQEVNDAHFNKIVTITNPQDIAVVEKEQKRNKGKYIALKWVLSLAASFLLVLAVGSWWAGQHYSNEALVTINHNPLLDNIQANNIINQTILKKAELNFFNQDFKSAVEQLSLITKDDGNDFYKAQYLLAFAKFRLKDYNKAIELFNRLLNEYYEFLPIEFKNNDQIKWTRLLALIGNNQSSEAFFKEELDYFLNGKSEIYKKKAIVLQNAIESPWRNLVESL